MGVALYGLEAEILLKMAEEEPIAATSTALRNAKNRLESKGLMKNDSLTDFGISESEWRLNIIQRVRDVYDLKPGGGYMRELHLVYEPATPFSYAYNWCGLHGISTVKTDPRKGTTYFEIADTKFWLEGNQLSADEITFNMPTPQTIEQWGKGTKISMDPVKLWRANNAYFKFFLDLKEDCFYDVLNLAAFQSWLVIDDTQFVSCFFIAVKGAYGGGKSVSCEALIFLGRHGKIVDPSVAFIGRSMERLGFTVFMDEFDVIMETNPEMGRLARRCQRKGQTYDRSTKSGKPESFKVFGPWIMSVHGELEDALATRTIPITTEETVNPDVPVVNPEKVRIGQQIYDEMWVWYIDNIDNISYEAEKKRGIEFNLDMLVKELVVEYDNRGDPYVTVGKNDEKGSKIDGFDLTDMTTHILDSSIKSNISNISKESKTGKNKISELRSIVAQSVLSSCTDKQKKIIKGAAGRNIELMVTAFKIANIVGIDCDESIRTAFEIKREVEEEEREVGLVGHLRDFLVDTYRKRHEIENYWTRSGLFMVSNIECSGEFNVFLHRREQPGVTPGEYKQALRELGFIRPTSRKKMAIKTWKEIEDGEEKSKVRLANVYTESVCRKMGLTTEKPDFGQSTLNDQFNSVPIQNDEIRTPPKTQAKKTCSSCGIPLNNDTGIFFDNQTMQYRCRSCHVARERQEI